MRDNETSPSGLVLGLPCHDSAVYVVRVRPGREDEEEWREAENNVHQGGDRAL